MEKPSTPQQREIAGNFEAALSRAGTHVERPTVLPQGKKRDTQAFVLPMDWVVPDPSQVRKQGKSKDDAEVKDLARSIAEQGLLQPIEVREIERDKRYIITAGEGRYVATRDILGWKEITCRIVDANAEQILWRQLHENIHRRALHPLDLASAIKQAIDGGLSLAAVAIKMAKSEPWVQKALTVAERLEPTAKAVLQASPKSESLDVAYEVATVAKEQQREVAQEIIERDLSRDEVRELTREKKRQGDEHHSGRTGRKAGKKEFSLTLKHDKFIVQITTKKKNVEPTEVIAALEAMLADYRAKHQAKAA